MRNPIYEQALRKQGVQFEYVESVPDDEINWTRGKQMQARLLPLDQTLIDEYALMFEQGFEPPPLLLWKHHKSLLVPLDGNQRGAANAFLPKSKKRKAWSAYIVNLDDLMVVDRLCWQFNNMVNGRRLSYEECMNHAVTFVRKYNQPESSAAKEWGVKVWELTAKVREMNLRDMAAKNSINTDNVPQATLLVLNPLTLLGEDIAIKAIKTVAEAGVGQSEAKELAQNVAKAKTNEAKHKVIDEFASSEKTQRTRAETKGGRMRVRPSRLPRTSLQLHADNCHSLLGKFEDAAFKPVGKDDIKEYREKWLEIVNRVISIYGLGSKLTGQWV